MRVVDWLPESEFEGPVVPPPRVVPVVQALLLDVATHDFPMDAAGFYEGLHPVDARVELAMVVVAGAIATAPEIGNTIPTIKLATPDVTTRATYEVRRALRDEVRGGNILVKSIKVVASDSALAVEVAYMNLRLPVQVRRERTVTTPVVGANPRP